MKYFTYFVLTATLFLHQQIAAAHSYPDHAEPKVGQTVQVAPTLVKIWFTADLKEIGSEIAVTDADGNKMDAKDTHRDDSDKTLLSVSLLKLTPGTFTVSWHAVSHDGHKTKGDFKFVFHPS